MDENIVQIIMFGKHFSRWSGIGCFLYLVMCFAFTFFFIFWYWKSDANSVFDWIDAVHQIPRGQFNLKWIRDLFEGPEIKKKMNMRFVKCWTVFLFLFLLHQHHYILIILEMNCSWIKRWIFISIYLLCSQYDIF